MLYTRLLLIGAVLAGLAAPGAFLDAQTTGGGQVFGVAPTLEASSALTVSQVLADTALHGPTILVAGTITDVCQEKGCWLVVTDGNRQMRVTFKDYGFFVPKNSHGRKVLLQGVVSVKEISEEKARHYAAESKSGPKPAEIVGPQKVVTMVATGVVIADA